MPKTELLINHVSSEECRIAIVEDGKLEEFYQERASAESHVGNIYKGRVTNVEPAIQAAFIDFGLERNGFLHISDLHPKHFPGKDREEFEKVGHKTARHERPPIQKCLKRGQEVLVQVLKEGIGTKGPTLTSYLSIPGRFLVMMPDMTRLGVSRKVEDDEARKEMRDILKALNPPKEFGFIVRTAGIGQTKADLKRDLSYLQRLWKNIDRKRKSRAKTGELYAESDLVIRTIRDVFSSDIDRIVCDNMVAAQRARDFLALANPRSKSKVVYYDDPVPLFHRMGIEQQLDNMNSREVPLPSGGALVIDQTEALVAIDVNSGKSRAARDAETNAYKTNMEAVDEIARQLRLRDLGGLVVLDLIDMRPMKNRKTVETRFRNNLKKDRARTRIGPISQFGLLEMTRQRMRPSLKKSIYQECDHCNARGYSMSPESVILSVMRRLALIMHRDDVARIELTTSPDVAFHILNRKRGELVALEKRHNKPVMVRVGGGTVDYVGIAAINEKGVTLQSDPETYLQRLKPAKDSSFLELDEATLPMLSDDEDEDDIEEVVEARDVSTPPREDAAERDQTEADHGREEARSEEDGDKPKRRRRRRGGRGRNKNNVNEGASPDAESQGSDAPAQEHSSRTDAPDAGDGDGTPANDAPPSQAEPLDRVEGGDEAPKKKKSRRRRSRSKKAASTDSETSNTETSNTETPNSETQSSGEAGEPSKPRSKKKPRSRGAAKPHQEAEQAAEAEANDQAKSPKPKRRRRSRSKGGSDSSAIAPRDENGDVNGNVMPRQGSAQPQPEADGNPAVKVTVKSAKKPPVKPGRGYANRIVNG